MAKSYGGKARGAPQGGIPLWETGYLSPTNLSADRKKEAL